MHTNSVYPNFVDTGVSVTVGVTDIIAIIYLLFFIVLHRYVSPLLDQLTHPEDLADDLSQYRRLLAGELNSYQLEKRFLRGDGTTLETAVDVRCARGADGHVEHILKTVRDSSEHKRLERDLHRANVATVNALRYQCALLEAVTGATDVMLVYLDPEFNFVWVNEAYAKTCGMHPDEMVGQNHFVLYPHAENEAIFRQVRDTGEAVFYKDKPFELPDQPERGVTYWDWSLTPAKNEAGKVQGLVFTLRETTEYKRVELRLAQSQRELYQFVEHAPISMAMFDHDMNYLAYSKRWLEDFGRGHADLLGRNHYEVHPDLPEEWKLVHRRCLAGETLKNDEDYWRQADGTEIWLRWAILPWRNERGEIGGIIISAEDITESKQSERSLRQSEQRLRWALQAAGGGAWDWDLIGGEAWWSPEMYTLWGIEPGTRMLLDNSLAQVHENDRERVASTVQGSIASHTDYQCEFRIRHHAKGERWVASRGHPIYDRQGRPIRLLGISQDITERKKAEEALRESNARKDEFLAMLAHELRNPLAPVRNAAHVLGRLGLDDPRLRWAQNIIEQQVTHLARLVDDLLDVSRIERGKILLRKDQVDLADLIHQAKACVEEQMTAKKHRLEVHLPKEHVSLNGDCVRLVQVLQNLLANAAKFTPEGGHIVLQARTVSGEVEIKVRDNGMGITEELLPNVFDLFRQGERTLDRSEGGLGIGLTLVRKIVELHGGRVDASSAGPGMGSVLTVWLPAVDHQAEIPLDSTSMPNSVLRVKVLVVDDDSAILDSTAVVLNMDGHDVRTAADGVAALQLVRSFRPQVVLLDIGLPGMDGYQVARQIRELPDGDKITVVAVSGYNQPEDRRRAANTGFDRHLVKPVHLHELRQLLENVAVSGGGK